MLTYNKRLILVSVFTLVLLFFIIFISKKDQNDKLEELGINQEQAKEIKNDVESLNYKYSSDSITNDEESFLNLNGLKKDSNGLYYTYDKYQLDSKMIYFKKENGKWMWSILLGNWDNLDDNKYDNPNSIYNGYEVKQDKNKQIFEKLREFSK